VCDDHASQDDHASHGHAWVGDRLSRRRVLQGMVALAALAGTGRPRPAAAAPFGARAPNAAGQTAFRLGMHLHASASEGAGSMRAQLEQAALNGFDVAWFTEHDWRRRRLLFRPEYHFLANDVAYGGRWTLGKLANIGSLTTTSTGQLVTTSTSPNDPSPAKGSLRLRATSKGTAAGTVRYRVNADGGSRANFRGRIAGRIVSVDLLPTAAGPDAWGEMLFKLSRQVRSVTRPAGQISMLYRLRTDITVRTFTRTGTTGIVDVPVTSGSWQTVAVDLANDVAQVWGNDFDARDNSLIEIEFHATSRLRSPADLFFSYLRFDEQAGYDAVGVEHALVDRYAATVPSVLGLIGTELSLGPHLNQYGGEQAPYDYGHGSYFDLKTDFGDLLPDLAAFVHTHGGLASINHPFQPGDSSGAVTQQSVARNLIGNRAGGADILEVGYAVRGGSLAQHLGVWDALSRNAVFLTGNGVSDDHSGINWAGQKNRFYTGAWSGSRDEPGLLGALAAGRNFVGFLGGFGGTIDMSVDAAVPMGAVSVSSLPGRSLQIDVTGLPTGGAVQVLRGHVDKAGATTPDPNTTVVATLGASDLATSNVLPIDTTVDCFHRLQVINSAGDVVAFGQPIWVLKNEPSTGIPAARRTLG
jgi:hypothetical protein